MAAASEIDGFLVKYSTQVALQLRAARAKLRTLFPNGYELVYDNYNALVFGYAPTERASEAVISIAGYPRWVTLFFLNGASLRDPDGLLQGSGTRVRSTRLAAPEDLDRVEVRQLIQRALAPCQSKLATAPPLRTVVKSVSRKQRSRQPSTTKAVQPKARRARA